MAAKKSSFLFLLAGVGLYALVTWRWNVALAAWLAPVFLMHFFRTQRSVWTTLPAIPLLWGVSYLNKTGVWSMDPLLEVAVFGIAALPMIAALYLDRITYRRLPAVLSVLVFPAVFVGLDYAISFLPLGTVLSLAVSQFYTTPFIQIAVLTGIWGIEFLVLWASPVINAAWDQGFDLRRVKAPVLIYAAILSIVLLYGGARLAFTRPTVPAVRVAGISVAHAHNYWEQIIDRGTPKELVQAYLPEMRSLENDLFAESEKAARGGARVIFWSEADAFLLPGESDAFLQRAGEFARQHQVYLMPAFQELRYGDTSGYNGLAMLTPQGEIAYRYEKTQSWYATTSDGILHSVETPYGRIGAAICFDLDFPGLIRQAAQQRVDIMLVPAFDTYAARVYHSEVGLLRGVEDGFSVMRMVNEGTSMAVDYRGSLLASQDFFTTSSRILMADLPTRGVATPYGYLGDWFAWLSVVLGVCLAGFALARRDKAPAMQTVEALQ